jgi:hypothetical protein
LANVSQGQRVTLEIPQALFQKLEKSAQEAEFTSVEGYILFVLEELTSEDEGVFSAEEEEKVKERLRSLGYL